MAVDFRECMKHYTRKGREHQKRRSEAADPDEAGWNAHFDGVPLADCPYPPNSIAAMEWIAGWQMAEESPAGRHHAGD